MEDEGSLRKKLKGSKRKAKQVDKSQKRQIKAKKHGIVDDEEKIAFRAIFEKITQTNAKKKLQALKDATKVLPKLQLIVKNFNDNISHLIIFERQLRKENALSIEEAIDKYNKKFSDAIDDEEDEDDKDDEEDEGEEEKEDDEENEEEKEDDDEDEEEKEDDEEDEDKEEDPEATYHISQRNRPYTFDKDKSECVKMFQSVPWVSENPAERVTEISIKRTLSDTYTLASPEFYELQCQNVSNQSLNEENQLSVGSNKYFVRYKVFNSRTKTSSYVHLDQEIFNRQKNYFKSISGGVLSKAYAAVNQPFGKNKIKAEVTARPLLSKFTHDDADLLRKIPLEYIETVEDYFKLVAKGLCNIEMGMPFHEATIQFSNKNVLKYQEELKQYYFDQLSLQFLYLLDSTVKHANISKPLLASNIEKEISEEIEKYKPLKLGYPPNLFYFIEQAMAKLSKKIILEFDTTTCYMCSKQLKNEDSYKTVDITGDTKILNFCSSDCLDNNSETN